MDALVSTMHAATAVRAFRSGSGGLLSALARLFGRHSTCDPWPAGRIRNLSQAAGCSFTPRGSIAAEPGAWIRMRSRPAVRHGRYRRYCATSSAYAGEGPGGERPITATAELTCLSGSDRPWKLVAIQSSDRHCVIACQASGAGKRQLITLPPIWC
jgi:hypothetical protein